MVVKSMIIDTAHTSQFRQRKHINLWKRKTMIVLTSQYFKITSKTPKLTNAKLHTHAKSAIIVTKNTKKNKNKKKNRNKQNWLSIFKIIVYVIHSVC